MTGVSGAVSGFSDEDNRHVQAVAAWRGIAVASKMERGLADAGVDAEPPSIHHWETFLDSLTSEEKEAARIAAERQDQDSSGLGALAMMLPDAMRSIPGMPTMSKEAQEAMAKHAVRMNAAPNGGSEQLEAAIDLVKVTVGELKTHLEQARKSGGTRQEHVLHMQNAIAETEKKLQELEGALKELAKQELEAAKAAVAQAKAALAQSGDDDHLKRQLEKANKDLAKAQKKYDEVHANGIHCWLWPTLVGVVVLGAAVAFFALKKQRDNDDDDDDTDDDDDDDEDAKVGQP
jgi:hypothetical protein